MELICEKYNEKMNQDEAQCRHPTEYCKFRSSCLIHFMSREKRQDKPEEEKTGKERRKGD